MDIVDAQLHVARGAIAATLSAMDSLGISAVMIDEFWGTWESDDPTHIAPGFRLPNGSWRAICPTAEEACSVHPDRFAYLVRVDRRDPDLTCLMRIIGSAPAARAIRIQPVWTMGEARAFADGAYDELFGLAGRNELPVCLFIPGFVELLPRYLMKFPRLTFIVDHCGMPFPRIPRDRPEKEQRRVEDLAYFDEVLKLAEYPNVALKWCHAQARFGSKDYPYAPLRPYLRKALAAFGAERLLWASDQSMIPDHSWSDLLYAVRDDAGLSHEDKAWLLGRSARRIFNWPAPPQPATHAEAKKR